MKLFHALRYLLLIGFLAAGVLLILAKKKIGKRASAPSGAD